MLIREIVQKYEQQGFNNRNAQNLAAEEIVLKKIASSPLSEHATLKGGIVMYNLTQNNRRVTQDIDFDLIRYSLDEKSLVMFVNKMNTIDDGIIASIDGKIIQLHQENYHGVRIHLLLSDKTNTKLRIKLDIGVHTYSAIEQEKIVFSFDSSGGSISINVNPKEQIFAEKLLSLSRLGAISTRYKDVYDLYYLIKNNFLDLDKTRNIISMFLSSSSKQPNTINDLVNAVVDALNNQDFAEEVIKPASKWIDVDYEIVKLTIIDYISTL